ncbi:MAG: glutamine synthetase [Cryobacterium sp.]|nr:glutamine synthetase [Cryobacterium sp.]
MTTLTDAEISADLAERGIRNLLFTMVDQAGIQRIKLLPAARVPSAVNRGAGFSLTSALLLCSDDAIADLEEFPQAQGDVRLFADYDAMRVIDAKTGLAWAPADQFTPAGEPFAVCQRHALRKQVRRAEALGLELRVAFELEFTLFRGDADSPVFAVNGPGYGLTPILEVEEWATDLLDACQTAGIEVEQIHPEYGLGQLEMSMRPKDPVSAVDEYIATRILVARTALAHGMRVSFAPVSAIDTAGNGCHIHFSAITSDGSNVFAEGNDGTGFSTTAGELLAGLVEHLRASVAMLAPSINSYARLQPGHFSGAYVCWGVENREAALRYIPGVSGRRGEGANVEVKTADGSANPYLAVATILACALQGVEDHLDAPHAVVGSPDALASSSDTESIAASRVQRMPADLRESLDLLAGNSMLRAQLGDSLVDSYIGIRQREWDAYRDTPHEERVALLRWKY